MSKEYPLLSIIVPIYDVEEYLHDCIQRLLCHTIIDFELLLINDGSPDNAGNICDEYAKQDIRIKVLHKDNGGLCSARNAGLKMAKGKWITFVDPDDWVENNYFDTFSNAIKKESDLIVCGNKIVRGKNDISFMIPTQFHCIDNKKRIQEEIFYLKSNNEFNFNFFGYTWNKFFKNSIIQENHLQFIEGLNISEDEIFANEYYKYIKSLQVVNIPIYNYLIRQNGLTKRYNSPYEYMLLATHLIKATKYYDYKPLIKLMQEDIITYMHKAIKRGYENKQDINFYLKRMYIFYNRYSLRTDLNLKNLSSALNKRFWLYRTYMLIKLFIRFGPKL